jgi:hypothetical protein
MGVSLPPEREKRSTGSDDPGLRRSTRVLASVPILVSGKTSEGQHFTADAQTLVVNAHGALISLAKPVALGEQIMVRNKSTQESRLCRIVYLGTTRGGRIQMGIEFLGPSPSFWQIDFPPDDWDVPEI